MHKAASFFKFGGDFISSIGALCCQVVENGDIEQAAKPLFEFQ